MDIQIDSIDPESGKYGDIIYITGANFGKSKGSVSFTGIKATDIPLWSDTAIAVEVPKYASTGNLVITNKAGINNEKYFKVLPRIDSIDPASGKEGDAITINGSNFGVETGSAIFAGTSAADILNWSDNEIIAKVPTGASSGDITVVVDASNGINFEVVADHDGETILKRIWRVLKNRPQLVIQIIAGILVPFIIFGLGYMFLRKEPDFKMSVKPIRGSVLQGGTITTDLHIEGIDGFKDEVAISDSVSSSDIKIGYNSDQGIPDPSFTSEVTISATEDAKVGVYNIEFIGKAADYDEHICKYTLTVLKTKPFSVEIKTPQNGASVPSPVIAEVALSGKLPEGKMAWSGVRDVKTGMWWPKQALPEGVETWSGEFYFGTSGTYEILVIVVNEQDDQKLREYIARANETGDWPGQLLPESAEIKTFVTVNH